MQDIYPARQAAAVTKSDTVMLTFGRCRSLYVGGAGDIAVKFAETGETAVTFTGVPAGSILPVSCKYVMSTNTTATAIVALY